ncbi:hypothetical protein [Clostridium arbusti]|uniref:hypothetical protein n=1 Tax=Clostridium arbusti TaxID=1137848 RepID=UPI00028A3FE3|nr:hypothetical protein [Clostridium arbusti]
MKVFLKLFSQVISLISIIMFFFILKLWIANDQLLHETKGFVMWGIFIIIGGGVAILMRKYKISNLLAKITLVMSILSIGLLVLTGLIFFTVSSMP